MTGITCGFVRMWPIRCINQRTFFHTCNISSPCHEHTQKDSLYNGQNVTEFSRMKERFVKLWPIRYRIQQAQNPSVKPHCWLRGKRTSRNDPFLSHKIRRFCTCATNQCKQSACAIQNVESPIKFVHMHTQADSVRIASQIKASERLADCTIMKFRRWNYPNVSQI